MSGDAWKEYAKESDKVWYYRATNADDVINVDFVTEPGLFQDLHLITRLTNNNGNFTFAAQVKLNFNATNDSGDPIWNPVDAYTDFSALRMQAEMGEPVDSGKSMAVATLEYQQQEMEGNLLPQEGDFIAIIVDALGGNDQINVGPTVQKTVWVDAGPGDDTVQFTSGNAILSDVAERPNRNDIPDFATTLGTVALIGRDDITTMAGFQLGLAAGESAKFNLYFNGSRDGFVINLPFDGLNGVVDNSSLADLVADVNSALTSSDLASSVRAVAMGDRLAIIPTLGSSVVSIQVANHASEANRGAGAVDSSTIVAGSLNAAGGGTTMWASFRLQSGGFDNDIIITSASTGAEFNDATIIFEHDADLTDDEGVASYDAGSRILTIGLNDGVTKAAAVVSAVDALDA